MAQEQASPPKNPSESAEQVLIEPLTPRELVVLHLIRAGDSNLMIANKLVITIGRSRNTTIIFEASSG